MVKIMLSEKFLRGTGIIKFTYVGRKLVQPNDWQQRRKRICTINKQWLTAWRTTVAEQLYLRRPWHNRKQVDGWYDSSKREKLACMLAPLIKIFAGIQLQFSKRLQALPSNAWIHPRKLDELILDIVSLFSFNIERNFYFLITYHLLVVLTL